jgi:putative transposase
MGFYVGGKESAFGWTEILLDLYERGGKEILVGFFDGLPSLEDAMKKVYPKADVQRCVVHKVHLSSNLTSNPTFNKTNLHSVGVFVLLPLSEG